MLINIIRGVAVYMFFISFLFLILNYFISKILDNDLTVFLTLIFSAIVVLKNITVIWK